MQGQRSSSVHALHENLRFDHNSTSSDNLVDSQMPWNSVQTAAPNLLQEYLILPNDQNVSHFCHPRHNGQNGEWRVDQSSSSTTENMDNPVAGKAQHTWNVHPGAVLTVQEHQYQPSSVLSSDIVGVNPRVNTPDGSFLTNNFTPRTLPQDLNIGTQYEDDECQIVEGPNTFFARTSAGSSSDSLRVLSGRGEYLLAGTETTSVSLDGQRKSRKRKAFEVEGQSSGSRNLNYQHPIERSQRHAIPAAQVCDSSNGVPVPADNHININGLGQSNPRFRFGVEEFLSASPFSLTTSEAPEYSHRSLRLRIGSHQQDSVPSSPFTTEADFGNGDVSSSRRSSSLVVRNRSLNLDPSPPAEIGNIQAVPFHVPPVRLNPQSRWNGASSSRTGRSSASSAPGGRDSMLYEEPSQRNVPRNISDHPIFVPSSERRNFPQHPTNWNFAGGSSGISANYASSLAGSSGVNSSAAPSWTHWSYPQYSRRLSEIVRRSLISSAITETAGQGSNISGRTGSAASSHEMAAIGSGHLGDHMPNSRSALLERHLDGAFSFPYSLRTFASASEGRTSVMPEIRHMLDIMRRGEGLRLEDVALLDQSVFFRMAGIHDRHRDMRLDVDNMSYEELLALEERIGNVCTGLNEETITKSLKTHQHVGLKSETPAESDLCSICREEYTEGEDLGSLECGHNFHKDCIEQWLMHKNLCPICKTTGITA